MATHAMKTIAVLDADSELGARLDPAEFRAAGLHAVASTFTLPAGEHDPHLFASAEGHLGYLVLSGLVTRDVTVLGRTSIELLGAGDLLRPWEERAADASVPRDIRWSALEPARVAVLDQRFARRIAPWPEIGSALLDRTFRRVRSLSFHLAILENPRVDVRLVLLFWQLADRWGHVGPHGVTVPLRLTHRTLGRLVRAQRPSVTAGLRQLADRRLIVRDGASSWLLRGDVSDHLHALGAGRSRPTLLSSPLPPRLPRPR